jgi:hypothetical protein
MNIAVVTLGLLAAAAAGCALYFASQASALRDADLEKYKAGTAVEVAQAASQGAEAFKEAKRIEANSKVEIEKVKGETANANERAGLAQERAANLEVDNVRLKELLQPRELTALDMNAMSVRLGRFRGRAVRVKSYVGDIEARRFATLLLAILRDSGLAFRDGRYSVVPGPEMSEGVHVSGKDKELVAALRAALPPSLLSTDPEPPRTEASIMSMDNPDLEADAEIFIGVKPFPFARLKIK